MKKLIFYTRNQCSLCRDAKEMLLLVADLHEDVEIVEVDIDESDELTERFGLMIPVVELDGEVVQYGQIDPFEISNRLHEKS
ncbi:glutaredoxin family protein [Falsibacillus pallidus]|uniref:Glutaredoxin-like protein DUF836 n=1 Tax=Falsibacillus pallidus TaxID=493781 RepID=A0A370GBC4_9BACI|nr:glutaredoxin family protein [Falsibacillus pallidus]RDI41068.1 glutaredoxin-like protein DUF836 [Falsibacillus pallidus]